MQSMRHGLSSWRDGPAFITPLLPHQNPRLSFAQVPREMLEQANAQLWMLAPPCQPYTRRGLQQDADDARARSFLKLIDWIADMQVRYARDVMPAASIPCVRWFIRGPGNLGSHGTWPTQCTPAQLQVPLRVQSGATRRLMLAQSAQAQPEYLLVENVVGFEESRTAAALRGMLLRAGYAVQEFLLSPLQLGVPYSRPRYFCIARKVSDGPGTTLRPSVPPLPGRCLCVLVAHKAFCHTADAQRDLPLYCHGRAEVVALLSLQLRADGSGTFPIPDQPDGRPLTEPPEQLLERSAALAPVATHPATPAVGATTALAAREAGADAQSSTDASTLLPVAVAPLSEFLTMDPSREGPFPKEARNLVGYSRHGAGVERMSASLSLAESSHAVGNAVDAVPACCQQSGCGSDAGTRTMSSCRCHVHQKVEHAPCDDASNDPLVVVDHGGCSSELMQVTAHGIDRHSNTGCSRSTQSDDPWLPFWLPDGEISARGAVMDIVTVRSNVCPMERHTSIFQCIFVRNSDAIMSRPRLAAFSGSASAMQLFHQDLFQIQQGTLDL